MMKKTKAFSTIAVAAAAVSATFALAACGSKKVEASATYDAGYTAEQCGGFAGAMACTSEVKLVIEDGKYTLEKKCLGHLQDTTFYDPATYDASLEWLQVYTFTGAATSEGKGVYTLGAAETCTYKDSYGMMAAPLAGFGVTGGEGDEKSKPEVLNYFYGPFIADHKSNEAIKVTVKDGTVVFDGYDAE